MPGINTGKVITGGLLAGLVLNVLDFANNALFLGEEFRANAIRLGLDPAAAETPAAIATWVIIDFLLGVLIVFTYAAIRPRFGPGPRTAIIAGLVPYLAIGLVLFGFMTGGLLTSAGYFKALVFSLITTIVGAVVGAWAYKEA